MSNLIEKRKRLIEDCHIEKVTNWYKFSMRITHQPTGLSVSEKDMLVSKVPVHRKREELLDKLFLMLYNDEVRKY